MQGSYEMVSARHARRIGQSLVHVSFVETPRAVSIRFTLFAVQLACMLVMSCAVAVA